MLHMSAISGVPVVACVNHSPHQYIISRELIVSVILKQHIIYSLLHKLENKQ